MPLLPVNDARGFTGAAVDSSTDLVDMQARWYGPELGRMLSLDPPGFREDDIYSFNLYAYGNNNPYRYVDPDGEVVFVAILVVGAALTAYDTYHAYQEGGAKAAAKSLAVGATVTVLTGGAGKIAFGLMRTGGRAAKKADSYVDLASPQRRKHILDGDATGGGHRAGTGKPGKSEFPKGWSDDRIMHETSDVATDPTSVVRSGRGGRMVTEGTHGGIDIRVVQERSGDVVTGFPTNVRRNP